MKMKLLNILKLNLVLLIFLCVNSFSQSNFFWQHSLPTGNRLYSIKFINQQTGYAVGYVGTIIKTTDGGLNWFSQVSPVRGSLLDISFVDINTLIIVGNNIVLRTTHGGD